MVHMPEADRTMTPLSEFAEFTAVLGFALGVIVGAIWGYIISGEQNRSKEP